jgi:hypothetical protein
MANEEKHMSAPASSLPPPLGMNPEEAHSVHEVSRQSSEQLVLSVLRRLLDFSNLEPDWDSYGGRPISLKAVEKADALFAEVVNRFYPIEGERVCPFDVAPLKSGGVQLEWRGSNGSLEVEIHPDEGFGYLLIQGQGNSRHFEEGENVTASEILLLLSRVLG